MSASLVGSEMCIRDSPRMATRTPPAECRSHPTKAPAAAMGGSLSSRCTCLLYTSDAADDM
eukprot:7758354-Alexandrium_andersonii.AAC.1